MECEIKMFLDVSLYVKGVVNRKLRFFNLLHLFQTFVIRFLLGSTKGDITQNVQNIIFIQWKQWLLSVIQNSNVNYLFFKAFQKMDTKKKEEQLKILKEKYGINTDPPK